MAPTRIPRTKLHQHDLIRRVGYGSLADQTTRALLDSIRSGRFEFGRLPPEPELASLLAVSRTTVRAALQRLEAAGVVSRAPARGTVVRASVGRDTLALQRMIGFRDLLEERGHTVAVKVQSAVCDHPDPLTISAVGLTKDTAVFRSSKTFFANDQPAIFSWDEVPLDYLSETLTGSLRRGRKPAVPDSIFTFSRSWPGHEIDHSVVEIEPAIAKRDDPSELRLSKGSAYLVLSEVHYGKDAPVAHSRVHVNDRFLRFKIVRHQ